LSHPGSPPGEALTLEHQRLIEPLLARMVATSAGHSPSDWSFCNLFLYRNALDYRWIGGPWPRVTGRTVDGVPHVLPLFAPEDLAPQLLREILGGQECLFPLTGTQAAALARLPIDMACSRDDADYIYPIAHFRYYSGRQLRKKRNLMSQCLAEWKIEALPYGPQHEADAMAVHAGWMADKGKAAGEADDLTCREALVMASTLGLSGFIFYADGAAAGFVLAECTDPGTAVVRFAKGLARYKGIAQLMFHHLATHAPWPLQFFNFEEDLGLANFRRTKLSYAPCELRNKWRIRLRD
jgi:hypothetical protein